MSQNSLLQAQELPPFSKIRVEEIQPAIEQLITHSRDELAQQLEQIQQISWKSLIEPLEERSDRLAQAWSPVSHMHAVVNSDELRAAYSECIAMLTEYGTEMGQHQELYRAYKQLKDSDQFSQLNQAQKKSIENALRDFDLAGVSLEDEKKQIYGKIKNRLSELSTQFSNNVMDANQAWYKHIEDEQALAGLPEMQKSGAKQAAENKSLSGYILSLDIPSYLAVMQYADKRELREEIYRAYVSRASENTLRLNTEEGPWDNSGIIKETLELRHQLALLLGFENYAELSLAKKMARDSDEAIAFLRDLAKKSRPHAERDLKQLQDYAKEQGLEGELQAWDVAYYSEKLKQEQYQISQEILRPYFPAPQVMQGMFEIAKRLYNIDISEQENADTWHADAKLFNIQRDGKVIARFYLDVYARDHKRGGAWMDECRVRRTSQGGMQLPVAYLVCNFTPAIGDKPALLSHDEVTTLFHEFGHGLHHMLTKVDVSAVSGINGVPWDAVELPSQFFENWCWHDESLSLISKHHETGESLPQALLEKLLSAKNFQAGMQMLRQIEFALFDLLLHKKYSVENTQDPQTILDEVRNDIAVIIPPPYNKFQNSFSHIFAGGYAAGYYSYKWAEVLSADAFSAFEENGIFDQATGERFLQCILEKGGSEDIAKLFKQFRGREPKVDALLRHNGLLDV